MMSHSLITKEHAPERGDCVFLSHFAMFLFCLVSFYCSADGVSPCKGQGWCFINEWQHAALFRLHMLYFRRSFGNHERTKFLERGFISSNGALRWPILAGVTWCFPSAKLGRCWMAAQCVTKWLVGIWSKSSLNPELPLPCHLECLLRGCECFPAGGDEWAVWAARRECSP